MTILSSHSKNFKNPMKYMKIGVNLILCEHQLAYSVDKHKVGARNEKYTRRKSRKKRKCNKKEK